MKIIRLELENFRNIQSLSLPPKEGIQLLIGENAQGKTNILESIFLSSSMRSFRTNKESMLIRSGEKKANIRLFFEKDGRQRKLEIVISDTEKKKVYLDDRQLEKMRDAIGIFQSVLFTPDHLMMVKGAPGERREFLDMAICAVDPGYTETLLKYAKALKNRNRILKSGEKSLLSVLPAWNETLCRYGSEIAFTRQKFVEQIDRFSKEEYAAIAGGAEQMKTIYLNQFSKETLTKDRFFEKMMTALEKHLEKDLEDGATGYGIHKDDLLLLVAGKSAKYFASQGQIRSVVLALKLAESRLIEQFSGQKPVILLDDILSELDSERQSYILRHTFDNQCFVTTCEPDKLANCAATKFYIKKGEWADVSASGR